MTVAAKSIEVSPHQESAESRSMSADHLHLKKRLSTTALALQMTTRRGPLIQSGIVIAPIATFVLVRWLFAEDVTIGSFAQCLPIALIASLLLDRAFVLTAVAGSVTTTIAFYIHELAEGSGINLREALAIFFFIFSVVLIAVLGRIQRDAIRLQCATIGSKEISNNELRARLRAVPRAIGRLMPAPANFADAQAYHDEVLSRLTLIDGEDSFVNADLNTLTPLHQMVSDAVLPFVHYDNYSERLPLVRIADESVAPLLLRLQTLTEGSLRFGALRNRQSKLIISGALHDQFLEIIWHENGVSGTSLQRFLKESGHFCAGHGLEPGALMFDGNLFWCVLTVANAQRD